MVAQAGMLARFEREMDAMRRMRHASVVPVIDFGSHGGLPFAVMPYLAGASLARRRPLRDGVHSPARSATLRHWLPTIADALDHVHATGYLHRDVKPDNILFDGQGRAVLADFGIATFAHSAVQAMRAAQDQTPAPGLTSAGQVIGTPEYVAPELALGNAADGRADQYALAAVVHEVLSGSPPIHAGSPRETLSAQVHSPPPKLADLRPELPASLCEAVFRGLAKRPGERFESCHEFATFVLLHVPAEPPPPPRLACPLCDRMMSAPHEWAGKNGRCPGCKAVLYVTEDLESVVAPSERSAPPGHR